MEYEIFLKQTFSTLRDIEKTVEEKDPSNNFKTAKWEVIEEIAVGYVIGNASKIYYFSIPEGCKANYFSYKKINHALLIILKKDHTDESLADYYRLLRKLKPSAERVAFLSESKDEIRKELDHLLEKSVINYEMQKCCQFTYRILKREDIKDFLNLCRENQIINLEYSNTFPIDIQEEETIGSFVSKEIFLFTGEIEEPQLPCFITGLIQSGFDIQNFYYSFVNKLKK